MHTFYFPIKTTWISSGSNLTTGVTQRDQNFGKDEILELKKFYYNNTLDHVSRALLQFDLTPLSKSIYTTGEIPPISGLNDTSSSVFLRLYEAQGNSELSGEYTIGAFAISASGGTTGPDIHNNTSMSWDEGIGKFGDSPKVTDGCSWKYTKNITGGKAYSWGENGDVNPTASFAGGPPLYSTPSYDSINGYQTFSYESPDINMDIGLQTLLLTTTNEYHNNGLVLRFSGSQEVDEKTRGNLKFFSRHTNTIYSPKIEVKWNDVSFDGNVTGSMNELTMSGEADNYLYMKGLKESYKEGERVKFRIGARKRYIQKTFTESVQTVTGSFVPTGSGWYSIKDLATDETIIPFGSYSSMSVDINGNYFNQWLDGFYPDRVYKILLKVKYDDGQEQVFDDGFEFTVKR